MFSQQPHAGHPTLNALPPPQAPTHASPDRTERHLAMLQRLAETGMQLAERAAAEALQDPAAEPPKRRRPDPTLLFIRLSAMVRACINQQVRLAAGHLPAAPRKPSQTTQTSNDPRRHLISAVLHDAIEDSPKPKPARAEIHHAVEPIIDEYLANDPELLHAGGEVVIEICKEFDIPYDMARMPNELLCPPGQSIPTGYQNYLAAQKTNPTGPDPP